MNITINTKKIMQLFAGMGLAFLSACSTKEKTGTVANTDAAIVVIQTSALYFDVHGLC